ncbi:KpsF/GutQ family sugar-phosphate isomerase [Novosphingobium soli]|uniref:SIS domain-containing protein n=1 Tax=Novosphingobium soli TaxID=574956 RepID=A0ABV6CSR3_9SPHN
MPSSALPQAPGSFDHLILRGREVIDVEAQTLHRLAQSLDETFGRACRLLAATRGRIVVTGVGKSGHIARKIAATLAATGSPAIYVHPAEAAHGDLGMVIPGDAILALSNSGSTPELRALFDHARVLSIPVVGMTSQAGSLVDRRSDVCLILPEAQEACPVNVAPTASTAQQLALGDAIAMVLMDMRGFGRQELKSLHPGGAIGLRLAAVSEIMHGPDKLPLVDPDLRMDTVISTMTGMGFGIAGVVDETGGLIGIITDGDLRRHFDVLGQVTARQVMTRSPRVLRAGMAAQEALRMLNDAAVTCAFVVADDEPSCTVVGERTRQQQPIGIVHIHDFLRLGLS